jgi:hypothetical protein
VDCKIQLRQLARFTFHVVLAAVICVGSARAQQLHRPYGTGVSAVKPQPIAPTLRASQSGFDNAAPSLRGTSTDPAGPASRVAQTADFDRAGRAVATGDNRYANTASVSGATSTDVGAVDTLRPVEPDLRQQQDRDAFNNPPAGYNPRAFQIERVEPLKDRRTRQFFEAEAEPFAHVGWRMGAFILFQELQVSPAWGSNVFFQTDAQSDWRAEFSSETRVVSNWANHALEFRMLHDRSYYAKFKTENDAGEAYELRGRLDITSRNTAEALMAHEVQQESRSSIDAVGNTNSARPNVTTDRVTAAFNHRFNRLSLQLRGGHAETRYDEEVPDLTNARNVRTRNLALRAQWEFRPTLSVFGELEVDDRRHEAPSLSDNLSRDSKGERYRIGLSLGQTGEYLRGEASIGYGVQRSKSSALSNVQAFLIDANLAWRITPLMSLLFEASTQVDETTVANSLGAVNHSVGVTLRRFFTRRLIGEAGVSYAMQDYSGVSLRERNVTLKAKAEYTLSRHAALFTRLKHVQFRSNAPDRDYEANTVMFGARLRN